MKKKVVGKMNCDRKREYIYDRKGYGIFPLHISMDAVEMLCVY